MRLELDDGSRLAKPGLHAGKLAALSSSVGLVRRLQTNAYDLFWASWPRSSSAPPEERLEHKVYHFSNELISPVLSLAHLDI